MPRTLDALPLRARKAARTRLALLDAVLARLVHGPLSTVSVAEVCAEVGVSQPTFFNYFGTKSGVLVFYVYLWSIEMQWRMGRAGSGRDSIQLVFDRSAAAVEETPWLMPEIVVFQIRSASDPDALKQVPPPSVADKLMRFGELEGAESLEPMGVQDLFARALGQARDEGELSASTDLDLANRLLTSLFFGSAASQRDASIAADTLSRGLDIIWNGLRPQKGKRK